MQQRDYRVSARVIRHISNRLDNARRNRDVASQRVNRSKQVDEANNGDRIEYV